MNKKKVVGIGEVLWDMLPTGKRLGGASGNFAYHVTQLGFDGVVVSAVGRDDLGDEALGALDVAGVSYLIECLDKPTGTVDVVLDSRGIPSYDIHRNVAWDYIHLSQEARELAQRCEAVCFGSLAQRCEVSRTAIREFLKLMPDDSLKVYDINLRQDYFDRDTIEQSMILCNVLKINDEELEIVTPMFGLEGTIEERCLELLKRFDLQYLILTCGTDGSYAFTAVDQSFMPTPKVEVADTVGAGDSFTAAFVAALLKGEELSQAHSQAVALSAYVCSCSGATPPHPN